MQHSFMFERISAPYLVVWMLHMCSLAYVYIFLCGPRSLTIATCCLCLTLGIFYSFNNVYIFFFKNTRCIIIYFVSGTIALYCVDLSV